MAMQQRANALSQEIAESAAMNGGDISRHYRDVQNLGPASAKINAIEFTADISSSAVVTKPSKQNCPGGYKSELFEIRAFMESPLAEPELASALTFQLKNQEFSGDVFTTPITIGHLTNQGASTPMKYDRGLYVFGPGATIECVFTPDTDDTVGYSALASAAKRWSILLLFNLFAAQ
jgi:hypothetical protein